MQCKHAAHGRAGDASFFPPCVEAEAIRFIIKCFASVGFGISLIVILTPSLRGMADRHSTSVIGYKRKGQRDTRGWM